MLGKPDKLRVWYGNNGDISFVECVELLTQFKHVKKPGSVIPFSMTKSIIDCPILRFNATKKMLEDPKDQKLVVRLLPNILDTVIYIKYIYI